MMFDCESEMNCIPSPVLGLELFPEAFKPIILPSSVFVDDLLKIIPVVLPEIMFSSPAPTPPIIEPSAKKKVIPVPFPNTCSPSPCRPM